MVLQTRSRRLRHQCPSRRVAQLMKDGLKSYDLVATWLQVQVLPLQCRVHRICDMATWRDPTRISTRKLNFKELRARVKALTNSKLPEPFKFGMRCLHCGLKP